VYSQCTNCGEKGKTCPAPLVLGFEAMGQSQKILVLAIGFVGLHLNYWMWDDARIVLGLPANLLYHVILSLVLSVVLTLLVRRAWPRYLDED
jgi:hypothetical protein